MQFDPENNINKLCAQGMQLEGEGKPEEAAKFFMQAWNEATTVTEQFTAAHYVARHQGNSMNKLRWDETALKLALKINSEEIKSVYPSLYLNIAKGYEDLNDLVNAKGHYTLALKYSTFLPGDGYGNMIQSGINRGIERLQEIQS